jgi:hypothetical protein
MIQTHIHPFIALFYTINNAIYPTIDNYSFDEDAEQTDGITKA